MKFFDNFKSKSAPASSVALCVDYCARLGSAHIVISGWAFDPGSLIEDFVVAGSAPASELVFRGSRPDVSQHYRNEGSHKWGFVLIATVNARKSSSLSLSVRPKDLAEKISLSPGRFSLESLSEKIAHYSADDRDAVLNAVVSCLGVEAAEGSAVDPSRLPGFVRAHVDQAVRLDTNTLFVSGWMLDLYGTVVAAHARIGERCSRNILPDLMRCERPDVLRAVPRATESKTLPGFVTIVRLPPADSTEDDATSGSDETHRLELLLVAPNRVFANVQQDVKKVPSLTELTKVLLGTFNPDLPSSYQLLDRVIGPGLETAPRITSADTTAQEWHFGELPVEPRWTVIVPLYRRYDFVFYQLGHFAWDSDFERTDLIYVVDDPQILQGVLKLAADIHPIYRVPFRVVHAGRNLGFAGANNIAARRARGPQLVLLNSDVLPKEAGWLSALDAIYRSRADTGALGPRLLFDDGTVQHDGIAFYQNPRVPGLWLSDHPGKGLLPAVLPTEELVETDAVTAACLMVSRDSYHAVGGLDEGFILGDFEDSDFCLKLLQAGRKTYLSRAVELFHLERQSQSLFEDRDWKYRLTLYNAWRHTQRWGPLIEELAERQSTERQSGQRPSAQRQVEEPISGAERPKATPLTAEPARSGGSS